jgi:anti-sigma B factor antagonist
MAWATKVASDRRAMASNNLQANEIERRRIFTPMNIHERMINDITVLDLDGNLAREENAQFRKRVKVVIDAGARKLILNLANVQHMDSRGLGELISCYKAIKEVGGCAKLLSPNHRLQNLLVITKLITLFEMLDSESAALASFANTCVDEVQFTSVA